MPNGFDFLKKPSNPFIAKAKDVQAQTVAAPAMNWNETIQEMYKATPVASGVVTGRFASEPKETFIGYQDAANYVLLSGPYEEKELTAFTMGKAWARFGKDTSLTMSFPLDKRDYKRLTTFSVPTSAKRKGAYGKL